jgi:hypothetical protein
MNRCDLKTRENGAMPPIECGTEGYKCTKCTKRDHDAMLKDLILLKNASRDYVIDRISAYEFWKIVYDISMIHAHGEHL